MTDDLHDLIGSLARVQGLEWVAADDDSVRLRHPDSAAEARLQLESIRRLPYPIDGPQLRDRLMALVGVQYAF